MRAGRTVAPPGVRDRFCGETLATCRCVRVCVNSVLFISC